MTFNYYSPVLCALLLFSEGANPSVDLSGKSPSLASTSSLLPFSEVPLVQAAPSCEVAAHVLSALSLGVWLLASWLFCSSSEDSCAAATLLDVLQPMMK